MGQKLTRSCHQDLHFICSDLWLFISHWHMFLAVSWGVFLAKTDSLYELTSFMTSQRVDLGHFIRNHLKKWLEKGTSKGLTSLVFRAFPGMRKIHCFRKHRWGDFCITFILKYETILLVLWSFPKWLFHKWGLFSAWMWLTACLTSLFGKAMHYFSESLGIKHSDAEGINAVHRLYLRLVLTELFTQQQIMSSSVIVLSLFWGLGEKTGVFFEVLCHFWQVDNWNVKSLLAEPACIQLERWCY